MLHFIHLTNHSTKLINSKLWNGLRTWFSLLSGAKRNFTIGGRIQVLKDKHTQDFRHGGRISLSTRPATRPTLSNQEAAQARRTVRSEAKDRIRAEVLAIKNKPPNKEDPTVRIFGPGDHHSWTEEKAY